MSNKIRTETIPERNILYLHIRFLSHNAPLHRWGLQGQFSPKMIPENYRKSIYPSTTAKEDDFVPRMSKKRKLEWQFFLNHRNRMTYNPLCLKCACGCKQSFRAVVMDCPRYQSKRAKKSQSHR
jgi:hypothetical protein